MAAEISWRIRKIKTPIFADQKSPDCTRGEGRLGAGGTSAERDAACAEYGVHQGTVRKALDEMAAQNLVIRQQGKGTFVMATSMRHNDYRFFRLMQKSGEKELPTTEFILIERGPGNDYRT